VAIRRGTVPDTKHPEHRGIKGDMYVVAKEDRTAGAFPRELTPDGEGESAGSKPKGVVSRRGCRDAWKIRVGMIRGDVVPRRRGSTNQGAKKKLRHRGFF